MRRRTLIRVAALSMMAAAAASISQPAVSRTIEDPGSARDKIFKGRYHFVDAEGDTVAMYVFNDITVLPELHFRNKKEEEFYRKTVRDVKRTLPYAKLIAETLIETYEYIETLPTTKEREAHLKRMEKEVFKEYKPILKKLTKSQAKLLVKLVQRETNQTGYEIVKAFLGSFRATFWQGFGKLFGVSLKGNFDPANNREDGIIERVCVAVEQGRL